MIENTEGYSLVKTSMDSQNMAELHATSRILYSSLIVGLMAVTILMVFFIYKLFVCFVCPVEREMQYSLHSNKRPNKKEYSAKRKLFYTLGFFVSMTLLLLVIRQIVFQGRQDSMLKIKHLRSLEKKYKDVISQLNDPGSDTQQILSRSPRNALSYMIIDVGKYMPDEYEDCYLTRTEFRKLLDRTTGKYLYLGKITYELLIKLMLKAQSLEFAALVKKHPVYLMYTSDQYTKQQIALNFPN